MSETSSSPRNRGGQPGNKNALKHGFYASKFTSADRQDLDDYDFTGLIDEILLLRVYIRRVIEQSSGLTEIDDTLSVLRALSLASTTITRLLRSQRVDFTPIGRLSSLNDLFLDAIDAVKTQRPELDETHPSSPA